MKNNKQYLKAGWFDDFFLSNILYVNESDIDFSWINIWFSYVYIGVVIADLWHDFDSALTTKLIIEKIKLEEIRLKEILSEEIRLEDLLQEQQFYVNIIGFCIFLEWLFIIHLLIIKLDLLLKK